MPRHGPFAHTRLRQTSKPLQEETSPHFEYLLDDYIDIRFIEASYALSSYTNE